MATEQYYTLKAKARDAGMTISECIRMSVMNTVIQQRLTPEMHDHIRKLCGMANNLNQIAHIANAQGYVNARIEYLHLAGRIDKLSNELMGQISGDYLKQMGISDTKYIIGRHYDKEHPHLHIVFNRVNNNGTPYLTETIVSEVKRFVKN